MSEQVDSALQEHLSVRRVEEKRITELDHSKQRSANHTPQLTAFTSSKYGGDCHARVGLDFFTF